MANTLFLRLEGPLQAWGERARWSVRDTAGEPTKSGVVGLLGCAMGLNSDEDLQGLARQIRIGVRVDRPGDRLTDYHTVIGGVLSAEGKIKKNAATKTPETVVSWRTYLCDASFLVAVQGPQLLIERLAAAVQSPRWPVYLGRKSCPPARFLFEGYGDYAGLEIALAARPYAARKPGLESEITLRAVLEIDSADGIRRRDETGVNSLRTFLPRYVQEIAVRVQVVAEEV